MIYLDYSATTPINNEVLDTYVKVSKNFIGNANSIHSLGTKSRELLESATNQISSLLKIKPCEVIYTSGATESNNLALKGIASFYKNRGRHIITTKLEHSSVSETLKYLETLGYEISYVELDKNGLINIQNLKSLIRDDTILVSICYVNSELGIKQNINEIGKILKQYPKLIFHVDGTQALGKIDVDLSNIDLFSFSAHKFFGPKGIGCLIKKENIKLTPLFHGGKSDSIYRSGTPALPLIVSLSKALRIALNNLDNKYNHVKKLNEFIIDNFKSNKNIVINSNDKCIPHIINISLNNIKPETFIHAMEKEQIFISTKSACSNINDVSSTLVALKKSEKISSTSIRISISHITTLEEVMEFLKIFNEKFEYLNNLKRGN